MYLVQLQQSLLTSIVKLHAFYTPRSGKRFRFFFFFNTVRIASYAQWCVFTLKTMIRQVRFSMHKTRILCIKNCVNLAYLRTARRDLENHQELIQKVYWNNCITSGLFLPIQEYHVTIGCIAGKCDICAVCIWFSLRIPLYFVQCKAL